MVIKTGGSEQGHVRRPGQVFLTDTEAREILQGGFQLYSGGVRLKLGYYMNHGGFFCPYDQGAADLSGFWHVARF